MRTLAIDENKTLTTHSTNLRTLGHASLQRRIPIMRCAARASLQPMTGTLEKTTKPDLVGYQHEQVQSFSTMA